MEPAPEEPEPENRFEGMDQDEIFDTIVGNLQDDLRAESDRADAAEKALAELKAEKHRTEWITEYTLVEQDKTSRNSAAKCFKVCYQRVTIDVPKYDGNGDIEPGSKKVQTKWLSRE